MSTSPDDVAPVPEAREPWNMSDDDAERLIDEIREVLGYKEAKSAMYILGACNVVEAAVRLGIVSPAHQGALQPTVAAQTFDEWFASKPDLWRNREILEAAWNAARGIGKAKQPEHVDAAPTLTCTCDWNGITCGDCKGAMPTIHAPDRIKPSNLARGEAGSHSTPGILKARDEACKCESFAPTMIVCHCDGYNEPHEYGADECKSYWDSKHGDTMLGHRDPPVSCPRDEDTAL